MASRPDLLSMVISLRPLAQQDPTALLPAWWGRAAHALLLNVIRQYEPRLAESLHDSGTGSAEHSTQREPENASPNPIRPFSVSSLHGRFAQGVLDPKGIYTLRLTALREDLVGILYQAVQAGPLAPGRFVELDYLKFEVVSCNPAAASAAPCEPGLSWSAATSYAELSASLLLAKEPAPRRVSLEFASPTTFKSGGKHLPVPLPELVFGSLLERWNAFAPIAFPPETRRYAAECLALSRYKLSTRSVGVKSGGLRVGTLGEATYITINYDRYWMSLVGVLAAFALFSGVGAGTSMGLGQCRLLAARQADPSEPGGD